MTSDPCGTQFSSETAEQIARVIESDRIICGEAISNAGSAVEFKDDEMLRASTVKGEMMKRKVLGIAFGAVVMALMSVTAFAQLPGAPIRANIPFDFTVRGRTLPAGQYEISRITDEAGALEIANIDHRSEHTMIETEPVQQAKIPSRGKVVFHRYGDVYFLYEVWTPGMETGREIEPSRRERAMERDMAMGGKQTQPETVAIAIN